MNQNEPIMRFEGDYRFLSNFWLSRFEYEGITWMSVETAYQAMKADDQKEWGIIKNLTASDAKRYGRKIRIRRDWEDVKIRIMTDIVFCKFSQNDYLKTMLLDTDNRLIVEGNNWGDQFWGVTPDGVGRNELGRILMYVRDILRHKKTLNEESLKVENRSQPKTT